MEEMTVPVEVKALDDEQGIAEFYVSVFGTKDRGGDVVEPTFFDKVIESGRKPKFVPNHSEDVKDRLGKVVEWGPRDGKLYVKTQFNMEKQVARDVFSDFKFAPEDQEFSFKYLVAPGGFEKKDGVRYLKSAESVFDVGPVWAGMHPGTSLIGVKALDESAWDGPAAMRTCSDASDFRQIAFETTNDSDPDSAAHWTLPHHKSPGAPANLKGVASALGYLNRTNDLKNPAGARSHLENHQPQKDSDEESEEKVGARNSSSDLSSIQKAHDLMVGLGATCGSAKAEESKGDDPEEGKPDETEARRRFAELMLAFPVEGVS